MLGSDGGPLLSEGTMSLDEAERKLYFVSDKNGPHHPGSLCKENVLRLLRISDSDSRAKHVPLVTTQVT